VFEKGGARGELRGQLQHYPHLCSGSEAGSYLRPTDFVYHSTLGLSGVLEEGGARGELRCQLEHYPHLFRGGLVFKAHRLLRLVDGLVFKAHRL